MWFKTGKPAAALCLYALLLLNIPLPPKCLLPDETETMRYTGKEIHQPIMATLQFVISAGWQPTCFGRFETASGFGWTPSTATALQEHSYHIFDRQRFTVGTLLLLSGILSLLRRLFRHYRNRRHRIADTKQDSA